MVTGLKGLHAQGVQRTTSGSVIPQESSFNLVALISQSLSKQVRHVKILVGLDVTTVMEPVTACNAFLVTTKRLTLLVFASSITCILVRVITRVTRIG